MDKVPMTAAGHAALTDELKRRQSVERPRIIEHIAEARSHGDLSENAEYHAAKEEQSHNEGRIAELEDKLRATYVIDITKLSGDTIKFVSTVTLVDEDTEKKTGPGDRRALRRTPRRAASSSRRRWRARWSARRRGPPVEVVTPGGAKAYEITKVEWR